MLIASKDQKWSSPNGIMLIKKGGSLDILNDKQKADALRLGYTVASDAEPELVELESITEEIESTESEEETKMYNPIEENKAIVPEENKAIEPEFDIERATKAKLIKFAEENGIEIGENETREEIKNKLLELYN